MSEKRNNDKKKRPGRGEEGYIRSQRTLRLKKILMYVLIAFAIFFLGLLLNKFEPQNIFSVIAVLMVLPATRSLVGFIVLFPYHSVADERVKTVQGLLKGADVMYTDMVFTSPEKVMFLSFLVITEKEILCLADREKEDAAYIERYLKEELKKRMFSYKLIIVREEENFRKKLAAAAPAAEVPEELTDYLTSLIA